MGGCKDIEKNSECFSHSFFFFAENISGMGSEKKSHWSVHICCVFYFFVCLTTLC